jgi:hypothetical protein
MDLTCDQWETIYEHLMGGFEDIQSGDEDEDEGDDAEQEGSYIKEVAANNGGKARILRSGYLDDGFVCDSDEEDGEEDQEVYVKKAAKIGRNTRIRKSS